MDLDNLSELKPILFHQYHGQYLDTDKGMCRLRDSDFIETLSWIKLRPITDITDDEISDILKIVYGEGGNLTVYRNQMGVTANFKLGLHEVRIYFNKYFDGDPIELAFKPRNILGMYQYLISKGFDLPHYLLNRKTLEQVGLAKY